MSTTDTTKAAKFRKRPGVEITASQWFKAGDHPAVLAVDGDASGYIEGSTGTVIVAPGDWIVTDLEGGFYPIKPHMFILLYDPAPVEGETAGTAQ